VAFVGNSGSGKTSLVKILCGLFAITAGDYVVGGYSVRELARGELKNRVSVLFQDFVRYNFTLKRNIVLSRERKKVNQTLYEKAKKISEVDVFLEKENMSEEQVLGKFLGTRELSPGHWQRLAIARMIYRNRDIMIMDEPFTFIDGPSRHLFLME
jgi:ABC-type multidrug transport system fused ATPase/permease subunit